MAISPQEKDRQKALKNGLFNKPIRKPEGAIGVTIHKDKVAMSEKIERDTAAFLAAGKKIKELPSDQVPARKRPAMQQYGNSGFEAW